MVLSGNVTSGIGTAKMWVGKINGVFKNRTGITLFPGTLNIKLEEDYIVKPDWIITRRVWRHWKCTSPKMRIVGQNSIYSESWKESNWTRWT